MNKNMVSSFISTARESLEAENIAKKLADNFEEHAIESLKSYFQQEPNAALSSTFIFCIDIHNIDLIDCVCPVDDINVYTEHHDYDELDSQIDCIYYNDKDDAEYDLQKTYVLNKLRKELKKRGYLVVKYSKDENILSIAHYENANDDTSNNDDDVIH